MATFVYWLMLIELIVVAGIDIKIKKISNLWSIANLIFGALLYFLLPQNYIWTWEALIFPSAFLVFGFLFFIIKIMGAGDSKYLASLFIVLPSSLHFLYFEKLIESTLVVGFILILMRIIPNFSKFKAYVLNRYWKGVKEIIASRLSYAPVILLAWIMFGASLWD